MKVGIAGSLSEIKGHVCVLEKINEIAVAGTWTVNGKPEMATHHESGISVKAEKIIENSDALIITGRGNFYFNLATLALRSARHVFLYTPVMPSLSDAFELIKLGSEANVILKCGRTGKYGLKGLLNNIPDLRRINMIEFHHSIKFTDKSVQNLPEVLLADMEIISKLIQARNTSVKAKGICIISQKPDVINARLEFDNGASVNYYCNIISTHNEHSLNIVLNERILNYNLMSSEISGWYIRHNEDNSTGPVFIEKRTVETTNYLHDDLSSFFGLIKSGPAFPSIYDNGFESFVLSDRILEKVSKTLVQFA